MTPAAHISSKTFLEGFLIVQDNTSHFICKLCLLHKYLQGFMGFFFVCVLKFLPKRLSLLFWHLHTHRDSAKTPSTFFFVRNATPPTVKSYSKLAIQSNKFMDRNQLLPLQKPSFTKKNYDHYQTWWENFQSSSSLQLFSCSLQPYFPSKQSLPNRAVSLIFL